MVFAFACGFFCWLAPIVYRRWHTPYATLIKLIIHGAVFLLTIVPARFVVESLQLPPQDFDLTVSVLTIILYIPCLLLFFSLLAIVFFVLFAFKVLCHYFIGLVKLTHFNNGPLIGPIIFMMLYGIGITSDFFEVRIAFSIFLLLFFIANLSFVVSLQKRFSEDFCHMLGAGSVAAIIAYGWQPPC